jgi:hypothetical protein
MFTLIVISRPPFTRLKGLEQCRLSHCGGQRLQRLFDDSCPKLQILFRGEPGITANMLNASPSDNPWCASRKRKAEESRYQCDRNTSSLNLLRYRCAATITGPSGGNHYDGIDAFLLEIGSHLFAHPLRVGDCRATT